MVCWLANFPPCRVPAAATVFVLARVTAGSRGQRALRFAQELLGARAIMVPMGQSSDRCHLANERIRRVNLVRGKNVMRRILESFRGSDPSDSGVGAAHSASDCAAAAADLDPARPA